MSEHLTPLGTPPPALHLPQHDLDQAVGDLESALRQLQSARDVQWRSGAADLFRGELFRVIGEVRRLQERVWDAEDAWEHFRRTAREHGQ